MGKKRMSRPKSVASLEEMKSKLGRMQMNEMSLEDGKIIRTRDLVVRSTPFLGFLILIYITVALKDVGALRQAMLLVLQAVFLFASFVVWTRKTPKSEK